MRCALRLPSTATSLRQPPQAARRLLSTEPNEASGDLLSRVRAFMAVEGRLSKLSHFSNMMCFAGLAQTDMLFLQSFMVVNSATNVMFNVMQPKPLWVPSSYSIVFVCVSASAVLTILSERFATLSAEEQPIFDAHFSATFDKAQFKKFFALSSGVQTATAARSDDGGDGERRGTRVLRRGGPADLVLLLDGENDVTLDGADGRAPEQLVRGPGLIGEVRNDVRHEDLH